MPFDDTFKEALPRLVEPVSALEQGMPQGRPRATPHSTVLLSQNTYGLTIPDAFDVIEKL
jgi:hypothetical protein